MRHFLAFIAMILFGGSIGLTTKLAVAQQEITTGTEENDFEAVKPEAREVNQEAKLSSETVVDAVKLKSTISDIYEKKINKIIGRYVPAGEYFIDIKADLAKKAVSALPYSPAAITTGSLKALSAAQLLSHTTSVETTIFLSQRFNAKAQERLKSIIESKLLLTKDRGDQFSFKPLGIPFDRATSEVERDLARTEADLRQKETDLKQQQVLNSETQKQLEEANAQLKDLGLTEGSSVLEKAGIPVAVAVASLLGLFALAFAFIRAGSKVGGSVSGVARSLEMISGSLESSEEGSGATEVAQADDILAIGGDVQGSGISLETAYDQGMNLHKRLLEALTPETEQVVLNHVNSLLCDSATVGKAVCSLEILGSDKANELYAKLSGEDQQEILRFMRSGSYDRPKAELLLEAGEELKSKMMAGAFRKVSADTSAQVSEKLLQLSDEDLVEVASLLHSETLPRLFVYLEPFKIANILNGIKVIDESKFAESLSCIPQLPNATTDKNLDDELIPVLDQQIDKNKNDTQRAYLTFYQDIIESSDESLAEQIMTGLSASQVGEL